MNRNDFRLGFVLQGTRGAYHAGRHRNESGIVCHPGDDRSDTEVGWVDLETVQDWYTPEPLRRYGSDTEPSSHGGTDYKLKMDVIETLFDRGPMPIDIDATMDMTLPGLASQASIERSGEWIDVPDSRIWK